MASLKHTHTYVKYKRRPGYWRCADPHCTHYIEEEVVRGKASLCNICKTTEFIMDSEALRRSVPRCLGCSDTKRGKMFRAAKRLAEQSFSANVEGLGDDPE